MKVLVLGATGMAGHTIAIYLQAAGYQVTAFSRTPFSMCPNIIGDVEDLEMVMQIITAGSYDAIINSVGILNEDAEKNKPLAVTINSHLPHYLSLITRNMATRVIQISTDCVFSGHTGSYNENSLRDGQSFYDRTKALGELGNDNDLTFRTSIIGPDLKGEGIGLLNWFMKQKGEINGFTHAIWTGVTSLTLAKAIDRALNENLTGLYHLVNNKPINKHDLLQLFNRFMRGDQVKIKPSDLFTVDKSLVNTRRDFTFTVPDYEPMIVEMKQWIDDHPDLYPHYFE